MDTWKSIGKGTTYVIYPSNLFLCFVFICKRVENLDSHTVDMWRHTEGYHGHICLNCRTAHCYVAVRHIDSVAVPNGVQS